MRNKSMLVLVTVVAMGIISMCLTFVSTGRADEHDQATRLTFNQPIQIPGNKVLAAGTYWFVVPDIGNAQFVQIFSEDRTRLYATLTAETVLRRNITNDTEVVLAEPPKDEPKQLLSWFYPDRADGHQFVYTREQEKNISREDKLTVVTSPMNSAYGD